VTAWPGVCPFPMDELLGALVPLIFRIFFYGAWCREWLAGLA
jgi:hypothetical protein